MARGTISAINVELAVKNAMRPELNKAREDIAKFASSTKKQLEGFKRSTERSSKSILQMRRNIDTAVRGLAGSFVIRELVQFSRQIAQATSDFQMLNQRIKVFTGNSAGLGEAYAAAQDLGVAVDNVASGMGRIVAIGADMGVTTEEARKMTVTFQQLALLSGSSVKESQAAFIQFTQALSSNRLSGEELRSVREQAPLVAKAIADYMGISVGEIKKVAEESKITAEVMRGAMAMAAEDAAAKFKMLPVTLERQTAKMKNAWKMALAGLDTITKSSQWWRGLNDLLTRLFENFAQKTLAVEFMSEEQLRAEQSRLQTLVKSYEKALPDDAPMWQVEQRSSDSARLAQVNARLELLRIEKENESSKARQAEYESKLAAAEKARIEALEKQKKLMKEMGELYFTAFDNVGGIAGDGYGALDFIEGKVRAVTDSLKDNLVIQRMLRNEAGSAASVGAAIQTSSGALDDELKRYFAGVKEGGIDLSGLETEFEETVSTMTVFAEQAARNMQDAFADFLFDPFKDGLKGMLKSFIDTIRRMVAQIVAQQILTSFFTWMGGLGGALGSFGNAALAGIKGKAVGGYVGGGRPYMVGERGPELFVPGTSGKIIPNNALGGGGVVINYSPNIDARGATQDLAKQLPGILAAHARQTVEMARRAINDDVSRNAFGRA